eukprot:CAMPEP_0183708946 /NCGR_PEP_ID=MMETSP0737-20130205/5100_1 /TAXON_ID=385413 /ORGANISM="Thalassiosira miniscula, Strain CCMP1093" /LENGTH=270 /DNA_ID=CAMNT_0025936917 /DNA_START=430 /DNA_END=1242 /DNA_ORIENTATION=+
MESNKPMKAGKNSKPNRMLAYAKLATARVGTARPHQKMKVRPIPAIEEANEENEKEDVKKDEKGCCCGNSSSSSSPSEILEFLSSPQKHLQYLPSSPQGSYSTKPQQSQKQKQVTKKTIISKKQPSLFQTKTNIQDNKKDHASSNPPVTSSSPRRSSMPAAAKPPSSSSSASSSYQWNRCSWSDVCDSFDDDGESRYHVLLDKKQQKVPSSLPYLPSSSSVPSPHTTRAEEDDGNSNSLDMSDDSRKLSLLDILEKDEQITSFLRNDMDV